MKRWMSVLSCFMLGLLLMFGCGGGSDGDGGDDNILDPNTTLNKRTLNIKIDFKPDDDREMVDITIECNAKLAGDSPIKSRAFLGKDIHGKAEAHEVVRQEQIDLPDNVSSIRKEA